ncbi:uncharacterized protein PHALS_15389 [Plasmopara halstedii]|uniref:Uncharacterized protein n=1 Tax=Plasmopara halstedii TaxID=4781 RepID=A0A0N7L4S6_PLAHL|nr:uncharacterized protein PHALS_15389 [Plasmopara halstedii]CEG39499.1 hypothetical protein PHALS_15389 [Plasmopara halstedii]|eukprot:XP_024575868.1 hypothetical protein PHALS_15389 [Plasmopara halstedii]
MRIAHKKSRKHSMKQCRIGNNSMEMSYEETLVLEIKLSVSITFQQCRDLSELVVQRKNYWAH